MQPILTVITNEIVLTDIIFNSDIFQGFPFACTSSGTHFIGFIAAEHTGPAHL